MKPVTKQQPQPHHSGTGARRREISCRRNEPTGSQARCRQLSPSLLAIWKRSKKVKSNEEIAQVGTISSNGEVSIGNMIAEAMQKVGNEGVITVEAKGLDSELDVVEGKELDRGYLSPYFITNADKMTTELDDPLILLHESKLTNLLFLLPILKASYNPRVHF